MNQVDRSVLILKKLLELGLYSSMLNRITSLEVPLSCDLRLLRLYGVALGMTGDHLKARIIFLEAFEISNDTVDLANCLTSYWPLHDADTANQIIADAFPILSERAKTIIASSAIEAVRVGECLVEDLPTALREYLQNVAVIGGN